MASVMTLLETPFSMIPLYDNFLKQGQLLTKTLMLQGNSECPLKSSFANFTVTIIILFAITNYHLVMIMWNDCFIRFKLSFSYYDQGLMAGATGQQMMLTPPWYLILPSPLSGSVLTFNQLFMLF